MLEAIRNRRSVRFYKPEPVSDEQVNEILMAGFCAPSGHAARAWHSIVVRDQAKKDTLAGIHRWSRILAKAPVVIVVCVDTTDAPLWIEDGSAFMENMLIQATDMGLGACWVAMRGPEEEIVRKTLSVPENLRILAGAAIGVPARYPGPHEPTLPEGRVHYDSFEV